MSERPMIPVEEYAQRRERAAGLVAEAGFDVLVANSSDTDASNVRYFTAYWPLFEMGGVAIAPSGQAALMVGMESGEYARGRSHLPNVHLMKEYRETADPVYPGVAGSTYPEVFESIGVRDVRRIGVAGYLCTNMAMYEGLRGAYPDAEIVNADFITTRLRSRKSPAEIVCLREGFRLGELALEAMLGAVTPGMTELELAGIAIDVLYRNGAECEAHTVYSFGGRKTSNAISRGTHRRFEKGDIVQVNVGGRVDGYSPSVGRPLCLGTMTDRQRRLIEFGRDMHYRTFDWVRAGVVAKDVAIRYEEFVKAQGMGRHYLYGPCTGLGLMEVEQPWMEAISEYTIEPSMTFQVDTFFYDEDFGLRWENGLVVTEAGTPEWLGSLAHMELIEIDR
jgi:Xaa-Pro aminopeptidase